MLISRVNYIYNEIRFSTWETCYVKNEHVEVDSDVI